MSEHSVPISENSDIASGLSCDFHDSPWERIENSTKYKPGGYHPLEIGDELHNGRYRIIHRLGHGGYSTVWLALDRHHEGITPPDPRKPRYVAVKIASAKKQTNEAATLRQLQDQLVPCKPGEYPLFVRLLDEFEIHGPNGLHHCLVTELLGPSIRAAKGCIAIEGSYHLLPVSVGRRAAVQCAKALASLHSQGIVHGGMFP
jgi:serine/threonine-protein kinase SRPK3